jgi:hypothetical protein
VSDLANNPLVTVQNTATSGSRTAVIKTKIDTGYTGALPELWMGAETATSGITGTFVRTVSNHPMIFYTNDVKRFELTAAGHIVPSTHNVTDLGLTGTRFKDAYFQGTVTANSFTSSGTFTASTPAINGTQTWNNAGANFYGVQLAITDTASGSGSRLFSGTVNTASMFYVNKFGKTVSHTIVATDPDISCGAVGLSKGDGPYTGFIEWKNPAGTRKAYMGYDNTSDLSLVAESSGGSLKLGSTTYTGSLKLVGSSSNAIMSVTTGSEVTLDKPLTVTSGTVTASTPTLNTSQTWNNAGVNFTGIKENLLTPASCKSNSKLLPA